MRLKRGFLFARINVAPPEATPSPFAISSLRYAPLRPANALRPAQQPKTPSSKSPRYPSSHHHRRPKLVCQKALPALYP